MPTVVLELFSKAGFRSLLADLSMDVNNRSDASFGPARVVQ